ncbi:MAG TPA: bacillithiol system redox-active protein YtxJ [Bacillota bacterium]
MDIQRLHSRTDVAKLLEAARAQPVLIFKHSATCPISARACDEWRQFLGVPEAERVMPAYLVVQEDREASQEVAERTGVRHESPQVLLLKGGRVLWHTSHYAITKDALAAAVAQHVRG